MRLRDMGNTVIVVEHDEQTMRAADEIVDFGPGPGVRGGEVVAQGDLATIARAERSLTAKFLTGQETIEVPQQRRAVTPPADRPGRRRAVGKVSGAARKRAAMDRVNTPGKRRDCGEC